MLVASSTTEVQRVQADKVTMSEFLKFVRGKLQCMSNRHEEFLENVSEVERLASGTRRGPASTIKKTAERNEEAWNTCGSSGGSGDG